MWRGCDAPPPKTKTNGAWGHLRPDVERGKKEKMKSTSQQNLVAPMKKDRGVAGLTILLSVVAMVFIIGFLVMVFAIIGSELGSNTTDSNAQDIINDTTVAISGVTQWFPIIITITVMVALILLTVIIIVAIRSSGILAGGQ